MNSHRAAHNELLEACAQRATPNAFSLELGISLDVRGTVSEACATPNREGPMSIILGFFAASLLSATGIYDPQLMHHGRCMAEPGSIYALYYCVPEPAAPPHNAR